MNNPKVDIIVSCCEMHGNSLQSFGLHRVAKCLLTGVVYTDQAGWLLNWTVKRTLYGMWDMIDTLPYSYK